MAAVRSWSMSPVEAPRQRIMRDYGVVDYVDRKMAIIEPNNAVDFQTLVVRHAFELGYKHGWEDARVQGNLARLCRTPAHNFRIDCCFTCFTDLTNSPAELPIWPDYPQ